MEVPNFPNFPPLMQPPFEGASDFHERRKRSPPAANVSPTINISILAASRVLDDQRVIPAAAGLNERTRKVD